MGGEVFTRNGITYLDPVGYLDFVALMSRARLVVTDSGEIQEETTILGIPCLTIRETTEHPVTITHGTNQVIGTDRARIVNKALRTLDHPPLPVGPPPLWDGQASRRIVEILTASQSVALRGVEQQVGSCAAYREISVG